MMKRFNKAFTLTELLVALGVIAVLCAVLMPIIFNSMPNQNIMMAKRAFYVTQTVVSDLINNEACYPDKTMAATSESKRIGFDDGFGYPNCMEWGAKAADSAYITTEQNAEQKFAWLFLNKISANLSSSTPSSILNIDNSTSDNMTWHFVQTDKFKDQKFDSDVYTVLVVDVNGATDKPNQGQSTWCSNIANASAGSSTYDRFAMLIYADGKVEIAPEDTWAIEAVSVNKDITAAK